MSEIVLNCFIFLAGTVVGSFLNMLTDRLPKGEDIIFKRSHCDSCGRQLRVLDLLPVFSYLFLGGKCRYCRKKIPFRNLTVELLTAAAFVFIFNFYKNSGNSALILFEMAIISVLIPVFFIDLKESIIPDSLTIFLVVLTLAYKFFYLPNELTGSLAAGTVFFVFFLLLVLVTKGKGMGFGDVKFAFFMGLYLGSEKLLVAFYLAFLTGALISLILVYRGRKTLKSAIPFGPFLVGATVVSSLYGNIVLKYFLRLIGLN